MSAVRIRMGALTERKDKENGGIHMLACSISAADGRRSVSTHEPLLPDPVLTLLKESDLPRGVSRDGTLDVTITMIDWASVLELEAIVLEAVSAPIYRLMRLSDVTHFFPFHVRIASIGRR